MSISGVKCVVCQCECVVCNVCVYVCVYFSCVECLALGAFHNGHNPSDFICAQHDFHTIHFSFFRFLFSPFLATYHMWFTVFHLGANVL